jgi:hypothetical protein
LALEGAGAELREATARGPSGGSDVGVFAGFSLAPVAALARADEPVKSGLVPISSIEPPASRSASSSSSAACFMTVCSCFGSLSELAFGNIAAPAPGRGGDEGADEIPARCGVGEDTTGGDDVAPAPEMPSPIMVDFPINGLPPVPGDPATRGAAARVAA